MTTGGFDERSMERRVSRVMYDGAVMVVGGMWREWNGEQTAAGKYK